MSTHPQFAPDLDDLTPPVVPRPPRYVEQPGEFVTADYQMFCGSSEAESRKYAKHIDPRGCVWLVADQEAAAEGVYYHDPRDHKSQGFGGRTINFPLQDGTVYSAKGPWASNAGVLFEATGVDVRDHHLTFVVLAMNREYLQDGTGRMLFTGVIYRDPAPQLGRFSRDQELVAQFPEAHYVYQRTRGGSSSGMTPNGHKAYDEAQRERKLELVVKAVAAP